MALVVQFTTCLLSKHYLGDLSQAVMKMFIISMFFIFIFVYKTNVYSLLYNNCHYHIIFFLTN